MPQDNLAGKKILIIDDDEDDYFITSEYIKDIPEHSFIIDWCARYEDALQKMINRSYDIYLIDYRLSAKTGLDLIREAIKNNCDEPLILLTGKGNPAIDMEAMRVGATDYLVKTELTIEKLERCIRYALERYQSLKALKRNERKYRNIFERSKDAVFITNDELKIIDANEGMITLFGQDKETLLNINLTMLLAKESDKVHLLLELNKEGEIDDWETELLTRTGEKVYGIVTVTRENEELQGSYLQGIIHDITDLKKAEKITLQIEKLAAAGRLIRTLAHEVRNPLNNINLSVEQIQIDVDKNSDLYIYLDIIQRNSHRISDLITELLDSSRPSEMMVEQHDLQEILQETISIAADRISLKKINLETSYLTTQAFIMADPDKLKIAFLNIIINAIEAIDKEKGKLEIGILNMEDNYCVTIKDNGCGIEQEHLSRLFEPYFTSKRNGMGLGLAATLNIIQAHKANIEVTSNEGEGTLFTIHFSKS